MLILASASPRRRELLAQAGYAFEVRPADVNEDPRAGEDPIAYVTRLAREKAMAAFRLLAQPEGTGNRDQGMEDSQFVVLGADTTVVVDGEMLAKPLDADDARRMLRMLSGRTHRVITGVAVVKAGAKQAAEKGPTEKRTCEASTAGAEAQNSFCGSYGPAEAVPLLQNLHSLSFSAACKAPMIEGSAVRGLKAPAPSGQAPAAPGRAPAPSGGAHAPSGQAAAASGRAPAPSAQDDSVRGRTADPSTALTADAANSAQDDSGIFEDQILVEVAAEVTAVTFLTLSDAEIDAYIATGEPMDKAGAYAIQGRAAKWIPRVEGCYFNVVGLPLAMVGTMIEGLEGRE